MRTRGGAAAVMSQSGSVTSCSALPGAVGAAVASCGAGAGAPVACTEHASRSESTRRGRMVGSLSFRRDVVTRGRDDLRAGGAEHALEVGRALGEVEHGVGTAERGQEVGVARVGVLGVLVADLGDG